MATIKRGISLALLAVSGTYIYDRISTIATNRPGTLVPINTFKSHEIKFADKIRNCEDVVLEEALGIAFLSCNPGRDRWNTVMGTFASPNPTQPTENNGSIYFYNYATYPSTITPLTFPAWPKSGDFHPLGLAFDRPSSKLYVISHSRYSGSVLEIFSVNFFTLSATHLQTFKHPLLHAPNSLELLGDGKLYVTNDHYIRAATSPLLAKLETLAGAPGGSVVYVDTKLPVSETGKVVARLPFANGIVRLNESTVVVASSSKPGLYFYRIAKNGEDLLYQIYVRTPAGPDNLSRDSAGRILVAGHPYVPPLIEVAEGRPQCDEEGTEAQKKACGCWAPSWVGEWSEKGGLRTLLMESGEEVCSSSTAVRDVERRVGMVSMLYGKGIMVFRE